MSLTVQAAARTHVGLVRQRNEDRFYAGKSLFAVADGLGGHIAGDIASATVIDVLRLHDHQAKAADLPNILGKAVHAANEALRRRIEAEPALVGMGTTLVAMLLSEATAVLANVGDSRAYLLRSADSHSCDTSQLTQLTEDHTYGNLVAEAASVPNLLERISRFLDGRIDGRSPDLTTRDLRPGDRVLLCSDGLSSVVPHELVRDALSSIRSPEDTADRLIALAIDHGGPDNITLVVVDIHG
ncbi:PP2C family protein-serine/threonine phosphatase [Nonomuraea sp. NPDC059194]|uniref:PP2C family protein-serine/threonine phosphatase n=1 Tax=Nonomuraea sp. NPDC059194 TaxID=3346764 RepID=UPI003691934C